MDSLELEFSSVKLKIPMKNWMITTILILLLFQLALKVNWNVKDKFLELKFDWLNENREVLKEENIDRIIGSLDKTTYDKMNEEYLDYTKSNTSKYKELIKDLDYYTVSQADLNKRIVGPFRLKEFICRDAYYQDCVLDRREEIHCIFNPKIFYKTLELIQELERQGYNKYGFDIVNGHRHPSYNERIGGASLSRHIKGEAVDITVNDINGDGYADKSDKDIILDILENKIIKDQGGIGLYPGTDNVHYDVRGTKARWNSY